MSISGDAKTPDRKDVDIVITTHNGEKRISRLLESISGQSMRDFNCFVIDDNSSDRTVEIVRDNFPWVKVIAQDRNYGPSKNRNVAARMGKSRYIAFFDDDVFLKDRNWLEKGAAYLDGDPKIGQLAAMIMSGYDEDIILTCGIEGSGPMFKGALYKKHQGLVLDKHKIPGDVLGASSAATIIRRDIFEKVGGFDPIYYYMSEDLDLSIMVHLAGYEVVYVPDMVAYHLESQVMQKRIQKKLYLYFRNNLFVLLEHFPARHILNVIWQNPDFSIFGSTLSAAAKKFTRKRPMLIDERVAHAAGHQGTKVMAAVGALGCVVLNIPRIVFKRHRVDRFRKRPREYLPGLNEKMQSRLKLHLPVKSMIFQITNKCNAACRMCFLHDELNRPAELLTLEEIRLFAASLKYMNNVVLGGGEPFLREDIDRICQCFTGNKPDVCITIPTNGYDPELIYAKTKSIIGRGCRNLIISLSLDGTEDYHDRNRNVAGIFKKVLRTYEALEKLRRIYPESLRIQVNTCVTKDNAGQLKGLSEFIHEFMPQVQWIIEPIRGSFDPQKVSALSMEEWRALKSALGELLIKHPRSTRNKLNILFEYGLEAFCNKRQPVPCRAGDEFIAVDYAGNVSACEILPRTGINIRQLDYDINRVLAHREWRDVLSDIRLQKCYCTHFCWLSYSLMSAGRL